jgi:hypothetical protein
MSEKPAPDAHERKNAYKRRTFPGCQVKAFMAENFRDHRSPSKTVKMGIACLSRGEFVPFFLGAGEVLDTYHYAAPRFMPACSSTAR